MYCIGLHNSSSRILFVAHLYKISNELIQLWVRSPNTTNALITTFSLTFHLDIFPSPISLNGESERKSSEASSVTALRKDLEVMKTL